MTKTKSLSFLIRFSVLGFLLYYAISKGYPTVLVVAWSFFIGFAFYELYGYISKSSMEYVIFCKDKILKEETKTKKYFINISNLQTDLIQVMEEANNKNQEIIGEHENLNENALQLIQTQHEYILELREELKLEGNPLERPN